MKSNAACTQGWSRSNSATAGIRGLPSSSAWTLTRWPRAGANCWNKTWKSTASAKPAAGVSRWKKNTRSHLPNRRTDATRHCRRPHHGGEVEPANDAQDRGTAHRSGNRCEQEHRGPPAHTTEIQTPREPQTDRFHQKPRSQSTVPLHRTATRTICQPRPAHHQCRYEEEGTNWQLQKRRRQVGSRTRPGKGS